LDFGVRFSSLWPVIHRLSSFVLRIAAPAGPNDEKVAVEGDGAFELRLAQGEVVQAERGDRGRRAAPRCHFARSFRTHSALSAISGRSAQIPNASRFAKSSSGAGAGADPAALMIGSIRTSTSVPSRRER